MDVTRAEGVHVLRYLEGETYKRHLDGCDTGAPNGPISPECERFLHRAGDRIASVIVMLQAPEAGEAHSRLANAQIVLRRCLRRLCVLRRRASSCRLCVIVMRYQPALGTVFTRMLFSAI